jgi:ankyrin repeat protein
MPKFRLKFNHAKRLMSELPFESYLDIESRKSEFLRAVSNGYLVAVQELLDGGVNVNTINGDGFSALHFAVRHDWDYLVEFLISRGANVNTRTNRRVSPLDDAIHKRNIRVAKILIAAGADVNDEASEFSYLFRAAQGNLSQVVEALLGAGANPDMCWNADPMGLGNGRIREDKRLCTLAAVFDGRLPIIHLFGKAGANFNILDRDGKTALYNAVRTSGNAIAAAIVEYGGDPFQECTFSQQCHSAYELARDNNVALFRSEKLA